MPTPTREQLASIEWAAEWDGEPMCPACRNLKSEGQAPDCWLAACLAEDVETVRLDGPGLTYIMTKDRK